MATRILHHSEAIYFNDHHIPHLPHYPAQGFPYSYHFSHLWRHCSHTTTRYLLQDLPSIFPSYTKKKKKKLLFPASTKKTTSILIFITYAPHLIQLTLFWSAPVKKLQWNPQSCLEPVANDQVRYDPKPRLHGNSIFYYYIPVHYEPFIMPSMSLLYLFFSHRQKLYIYLLTTTSL